MATTRQGLSMALTGAAGLKKNIALLTAEFPDYLAAANLATAEDIKEDAERNIKEIDAFDTGELYGSIKIKTAKRGLQVAVGSTAKHAPFIEFGTRPHFPPVDKIAAWCQRKGIPVEAAFPIAKAISERGTPERPFLGPAFAAAKRTYSDRIRNFAWLGMKGLLG